MTRLALAGLAKLSPSWTGFDKFCIIHKADENNSMPNIRPYGMGLAKHSSLLDGVWLLVVRRLLCRAQRIRATRCFGSPARESPTTRHAQKVRINPPPCFAILSTRMRLIMTIACPAPVLCWMGLAKHLSSVGWGLDRNACPKHLSSVGWGWRHRWPNICPLLDGV